MTRPSERMLGSGLRRLLLGRRRAYNLWLSVVASSSLIYAKAEPGCDIGRMRRLSDLLAFDRDQLADSGTCA